jgi:hypothetical protein
LLEPYRAEAKLAGKRTKPLAGEAVKPRKRSVTSSGKKTNQVKKIMMIEAEKTEETINGH